MKGSACCRLALAAACGLAAIAWSAGEQSGPIHVSVRHILNTQPIGPDGLPHLRKSWTGQTSREYSVEVALRNVSGRSYPDLKVEYYLFGANASYYGHALATRPSPILLKGTRTVTLAPESGTNFTSEATVITYTPAHYAENGYSQGIYEPASGVWFAGCGARVWSGKTLLASVFDPPQLVYRLDKAR